MSDPFHRLPALPKEALNGKWGKTEVTQEKLHTGKKGTDWMLAKLNLLEKQTKHSTPGSQ